MLRHNIIAIAMLFSPMAASTCPASLHIKPPTISQIERSGVHPITGACAGRVFMAYPHNGRLLVGVQEHYTHRVAAFSLPLTGRRFYGVGRTVELKTAHNGSGIAVIPVWGGRRRPATHAPAHDTLGVRIPVAEIFNR